MAREPFSRGDLLLLIAVLAAFGVADSGYLTWQWYDAASASWCDLDRFFSCTKVRESPYAAVAGIPTAMVGTIGFGLLLTLAATRLRGVARVGPWPVERWLLVIASAGAVIGIGLTLIEVFVIQAICVLCVLGFGLDVAILVPAALLLR